MLVSVSARLSGTNLFGGGSETCAAKKLFDKAAYTRIDGGCQCNAGNTLAHNMSGSLSHEVSDLSGGGRVYVVRSIAHFWPIISSLGELIIYLPNAGRPGQRDVYLTLTTLE
jgi:hypothetical protein